MLAPDLRNQAQKKLRLLQVQFELDNKINELVKKATKSINETINSSKSDPYRQRKILELVFQKVGPKLIQQQQNIKLLQSEQEKLRFKRQEINKEKRMIANQKESVHLSVEQIKETIAKMKSAISQSVQSQANKRQSILSQTEKSLNDIQNKINTFQKETSDFQKDNELLKQKKKDIEDKLSRLEDDFNRKARQKDEQVKKEKEQLMNKLQSLQGEVTEVTQLNKDYSSKEKNNFDKKLSLYLKIKKFPDYSISFQNSAKTIDQCKEELMKGIQRMNEAADTIARFQIEAKELCDGFTNEFRRRDEREDRIEKLKKEKELMRDRIIFIQNKIKDKKKLNHYEDYDNSNGSSKNEDQQENENQ